MSKGYRLKIIICGKSGLVGSKLEEYFSSKHNDVFGIKVRKNSTIEDIAKEINKCDVLINLSGASILARWDEAYKDLLYNSRIDTTKKLVDAMALCEEKPKLFISASAVGIYDSQAKHDENSSDYGTDYLAHICKDWEAQAMRAEEFGVRSVQTRFGVIYAKEGGAMQKMLPAFKMGMGGKVGEGNQIISWIHIDDLVHAFEFIVKTPELNGPINFTTKHTLSNIEQTKILGKVLSRPTFLPLPAFLVKMIFGEGSSVMLDSKDAYPKKLLDSGFEFKFDKFEDALRNIVE
ncbi:TIGR01777 family oxidoreductase [Sulfurimonas sp.]|uniref:TIGR01777 family oxidoreductase n=1 Tax=Sulfurimonas sp. TaxID=2022749 RepID=UPI0025E3205B|nr:TIGR01777 family oxidoreductase [Sulfurimonas sp.]